jgi:hypothetical protein
VSGTQQLAATLRAEGGLLAATLRAPGEDATPPADEPLLAHVPPGAYALTLAAVREGYLLHYAEGRVVETAEGDLALLGGDRLYALALAELVALGDLPAVAALADLISDCARAHADGDPAQAAAAWAAATRAIARVA